MAAASVGLSMALISLAKLTLVLFGLFFLLRRKTDPNQSFLAGLWMPRGVLVAVFALALSLFWTAAPLGEALGALAKYGKLLLIPLLIVLIQNQREASYAMSAFILAQLFLLASSYLLYLGFPVPWATSRMALEEFAVFSSYLDQGIIFAIVAAICWHLRSWAPGRFGKYAAIAFALLALMNVFFVLSGRSGHVVAIMLLSLAIMWELPRRYRVAVVLLPFVLLAGLYLSSDKVQEKLDAAKNEIQSFSFSESSNTPANAVLSSSSLRLHFWHRAIQSIRDNPALGSGVGSWGSEYDRLEQKQSLRPRVLLGGNPHQEYFLWGIHLGVFGLLVFFGFLIATARDARTMNVHHRRAVLSVVAGLATASLFNSVVYDALIGDFFSVSLGLLLALGLRHQNADPRALTPPRAAV